MALVQRYTETPFSFTFGGGALMVAQQNYQRVYVAFVLAGGAGTIYISTKSAVSQNTSMVLAYNTFNPTRWELFRNTHGVLVCQEWYAIDPMGFGTVGMATLEVIEEDTGARKSPGGVILGVTGAGGGNGGGGGAEPARSLSQRLRWAAGELSNVR